LTEVHCITGIHLHKEDIYDLSCIFQWTEKPNEVRSTTIYVTEAMNGERNKAQLVKEEDAI
jgi:hypothetical protein